MDINQNLGDMKKRIEVINRFNKLLKLIDEAVELMRKFHPHGERLYWVLYYSYMSAYRAKNVKEIIDKLGSHFLRITWIHRATYFRWQDQAFEAVGGILWGYEEESRKIMEYFKKIMKYMARDLNDHVGIVKSVTNGVVNTIEGNSGDVCARRSYSMGSDSIYGYGVPAYLIL